MQHAHLEAGAAAAHMDRIYRHQRFIYDLTRKYYLLGRDRMIAGLAVPDGASVLEVGCGTGRNLIEAARRYPHARFHGFDISAKMLETARANVARAGMAGRIVLAEGDAADFSATRLFGVAAFERVFISYALSMIPAWEATVGASLAATAPGGSLHVVDFGQQTGLPHWFGRGLHGWLATFSVTPRHDLEEALARAAADAGGTLAFTRLYRDYAALAVLKRR
ncbi:MAG: class I SAM-dependent methyltransferase [Hyphomicrobiaceae bacterium]|nr:class I SAM-dependent methyltransferase [Hyphomicrobiaceae bacterium]